VNTALITGATGQDGSYLCEQLAAEGVHIHAVVEDAQAAATLPWLAAAEIHQVDLRDTTALATLVAVSAPDEVYNLAGLSSVARSWEEPVLTTQVNATPVVVLLQAAMELQDRTGGAVRFVQASSAEIFGTAAVSRLSRFRVCGTPRCRAVAGVMVGQVGCRLPIVGRGFGVAA